MHREQQHCWWWEWVLLHLLVHWFIWCYTHCGAQFLETDGHLHDKAMYCTAVDGAAKNLEQLRSLCCGRCCYE